MDEYRAGLSKAASPGCSVKCKYDMTDEIRRNASKIAKASFKRNTAREANLGVSEYYGQFKDPFCYDDFHDISDEMEDPPSFYTTESFGGDAKSLDEIVDSSEHQETIRNLKPGFRF